MECTAVQGLEATVTEVVAELETEKPDGVGGRNQVHCLSTNGACMQD